MNEKLMIIKEFRTRKNEDGTRRASCLIQNDGHDTEIWFEVSGLPQNKEIESADAFFAPCLLLALKFNSQVVFEVPISKCMAYQAADLAYVFGTQLGLNRRLKVEAPHPIAVHRRANGAITGFSAGVDSWFSLKQNFIECNLPGKKLTHLLVNDVGANSGKKKKQQVLRQAHVIAKEFKLGMISVNSNMSEVLQMDFQKTHTARNTSVAHLLTSISGMFYYSSTDTYDDSGVFPTYDMAYADTIILPLLSTDAITLRSTGSAYSRAEKTREILDIPQIGERLDVCVHHGHAGTKINCGVCWKCCRTELTLEAFGALDKFEPVFDLEAYGRRRSRYIQEISASRKPTEREAFDLARQAGLAGPALFHQAQWTGIRAVRRLKSVVKSALPRGQQRR
ncbi:hypothetical protein [Fuscovulum ytuae]|uniref:Uncharacterized protein n=1 Tax=Fuscovulum ytuae TaxID=3042299 RepID=A0ABY8Q5M1_9RHOB|nr:hypothetical protein [Fuscovulum sp. YMD61]WGV15948.1 hypothetical protein QF092_17105 [Fuscovulum sp. YMD61]